MGILNLLSMISNSNGIIEKSTIEKELSNGLFGLSVAVEKALKAKAYLNEGFNMKDIVELAPTYWDPKTYSCWENLSEDMYFCTNKKYRNGTTEPSKELTELIQAGIVEVEEFINSSLTKEVIDRKNIDEIEQLCMSNEAYSTDRREILTWKVLEFFDLNSETSEELEEEREESKKIVVKPKREIKNKLL